MNKLIRKILPIVILCCFTALGTVNAQEKLVFKDDFKKENPRRRWTDVNGIWNIKQNLPKENPNWAILLCKKKLPEDYILTFSVLVDSSTVSFEVILNRNEEDHLGILFLQAQNNISIQQRSFYYTDTSETRVWSTGFHFIPKVHQENKYVWQRWRIQKARDEIYLWIDDESVVSFTGISDITRNDKGKFGFATNGKVKIENVKLFKTQNEASLSPSDFQERELILPFILFP